MSKAARFIKVNGIEKAKKRVELDKITGRLLSHHELELRRLVESWELVRSYGGLDQTGFYADMESNQELSNRMYKAIADVESCQ